MSYQKLVKEKQIKPSKINPRQINNALRKANEHIVDAELMLKNKREEGAYKSAYDLMLLAGRALVYSYSFRPRVEGSHRIVVDFTKEILGVKYSTLINKFNRMRKRRNDMIYKEVFISKVEAKNDFNTARNLIKKIERHIREKNPQKSFFK